MARSPSRTSIRRSSSSIRTATGRTHHLRRRQKTPHRASALRWRTRKTASRRPSRRLSRRSVSTASAASLTALRRNSEMSARLWPRRSPDHWNSSRPAKSTKNWLNLSTSTRSRMRASKTLTSGFGGGIKVSPISSRPVNSRTSSTVPSRTQTARHSSTSKTASSASATPPARC